MTFKLFNTLNNIFTSNKNIQIDLCICDNGNFYPIQTYDENSDIDKIDEDIKHFPHAELYVFDGDFHTPINEWNDK